jgi:exosome complex component RRP42
MSEVLWELQLDKIISDLKEGKRIDSRGLLDYRKIEIINNISENADGSARVKLGKTDVIAGVKFVPGEPYPDMPDEGSISVGIELLAMASPEFESGPPREDSIELSRVVDRGLRESKAIDFKKLCIKKEEKVWIGFIDLYILNYDGNLFDACSLAAVSAFKKAKMPKLDNEFKIIKGEYTEPIKLNKIPVMNTFYKIGSTIILDPILAEEKASTARLSISCADENTLCAMQKGNNGSFTKEEVLKCVELALEKSKELRKLL